MNKLTFSDYLNAIEKSVMSSDVSDMEVLIEEIKDLREHKASSIIMSKHLRNFKTLKYLYDKYALKFN